MDRMFHPVVSLILLIFSIGFTIYLGMKHGPAGFWAGVSAGYFLLVVLQPLLFGNVLVSTAAMFTFFIGFIGFGLFLFFWECYLHPNVDYHEIIDNGIGGKMVDIVGGWCEQITFAQTVGLGLVIICVSKLALSIYRTTR